MIIWSVHGYLVGIIGIVALVFVDIISESITGNEEFYQQNPWVMLVGMIIAAILTYWIHRFLLQKSTEDHTFFFVPVKWWPIVFVMLGITFML